MPELPEVETVKRGLEPALVGRVLKRVDLRRKDLRFPFPADFQRGWKGPVSTACRAVPNTSWLILTGVIA
jgi:formamidopyrimidine-DNA glycosylase